jgi:biofilm PGA synthesis N-glycosyltransferase PgaC
MNVMNNVSYVLFCIFAFFAFVQLCIYWLYYRQLAFYQPDKSAPAGDKPVSVIICARNESVRLRKNLPSILEQDYKSFEVIVVNDCSWDETGVVLEEFSKKYQHLKIVTIKEQEKYTHGKKFALTLGIKAASNEILLLTDADCQPAGKDWIRLMQRNYIPGKELVLGYGGYNTTGGLLNKLIRFDTFYGAMQYLSSGIRGNAYMGVGRNLSYEKPVFFRSKGFAKHNHILSGDDDLFVNENATRSNVAVEIDPASFTYSDPKKSFGTWLTQKARHLSTAKMYRAGHQFFLSIANGSLLGFYLLLITLLVLRFDWRMIVSLYLISLIARFPVIYNTSIKLKEKDLAWSFPILELLHTFLLPVFYTTNLLTKQKRWK